MNSFVFPIPTIDAWALMPVLILAVTGIVGLMVEMFRRDKDNAAIIWLTMVGVATAGWSILVQLGAPTSESFNQMVYRDRLGMVLQLLLVIVAFVCVINSEDYLREKKIAFGEFYPMLLWSLCGGLIMVSTKSLLMLFVGLEVLSIALYVLVGLGKQESNSKESAIKYFLLGAFGSAFLLYGIAFIFGATGSLHLDALAAATTANSQMVRVPLVFGTALIMIGLSFKSAFAPFHQWTPDVYQGAPTNITGMMASGSKIAAIGALFRVMDASQGIKETWVPFMFGVAILTMILGNVAALVQSDVKRVLGYSSIANAGYLLVGLLAYVQNPAAVTSAGVAFFLAGYAITTLGTFAVFALLARDGVEDTSFESLKGLYQREPVAAIALVVLCCSLIGVPLTAGFFGKFLLIRDAIQVGMAPLAIVLAITSIVSIAYYLRIMRAAFVENPTEHQVVARMKPASRFVIVSMAAAVLLLSFLIGPLSNYLSTETARPVAQLQQTVNR